MAKNKKQDEKTKILSTQAYSPIEDVKDGIVLVRNQNGTHDYVKIVEVSPINFNLRSAEEQTAIIQQFAGALRVMPVTVQFKVVSTRADPANFVYNIEDYMSKETSPGCIDLQQDQIDLISSVSERQGITRRFYLIFRYEQEPGIKRRPKFAEIKQSLNFTAHSITHTLAACGNEEISEDDSDDYTLSVLYSIFSRNESERVSFDERKYEVEQRYAAASRKYGTRFHIPVNDYIAPQKIDNGISSDYMIVDDLYYMFCYIPSSAYPTVAVGGWLQTLINIGVGVDVDFWIHKEDPEKIRNKLQYRIKWNQVKLRSTEDTSPDHEDLLAAVQGGYELEAGLRSDDFCYFGTMLTITAQSYEVLKYRFDAIKKYCIRNGMRLKQCKFQQSDAFISSLPICSYNPNIWSKSRRNILSRQLASAYPFTAFELADKEGILMGMNAGNGSLVFVDIFDNRKYDNANVTILGSTGAGKTYTLLCMALRMRQQQTQVFLIAPLKGMEFEPACRAVNGAFIKIASGSPQNINVMEIRKRDKLEGTEYEDLEQNKGSLMMQKIEKLHTFFSLLLKDISFRERDILDEALVRTYANFGITEDNESLYDPEDHSKYRKMPVLGDLKAVIDTFGEEAQRLQSVLNRYVTGSAKNFNQPRNVNLSNKFVVIDISSLSKELLPIGMFIALDYVYDKAKEDRREKKCIFIDECWKLVGRDSTPEAAEFVTEIFKVIRGYGGAAIAATQDLDDVYSLANDGGGKGIISNSKTKILMKTDSSAAKVLAQVNQLTEQETHEISNFERGTCLLIAGKNHVVVKVTASKKEHDLITTSASDLRRIARERMQAANSTTGRE